MKLRYYFLFSTILIYIFYLAGFNNISTTEPVYLSVPDIWMERNDEITLRELEEYVLERVIPIHKGVGPSDLKLHVDVSNVLPSEPSVYYARVTMTYDTQLESKLVQVRVIDTGIPTYTIDRELEVYTPSVSNRNTINYIDGVSVYNENGIKMPFYMHDAAVIPSGDKVIIHDAGVLYSEPGTYSVRYEIVTSDSAEKSFYRKVVINKATIPTIDELKEGFTLVDENTIACKQTSLQGLLLYVPGKYIDSNGEIVTIKNVAESGCEKSDNLGKGIRTLIVGDGIENIGKYAFRKYIENASGSFKKGTIKYVHLPNTLKNLSEEFVAYNVVLSIVIPESVTQIEEGAFDKLNYLKNIVFLGLVANIEGSDYYNSLNMISLTRDDINIYYPNGVNIKLREYTSNREGYNTYNQVLGVMTERNTRHKLRYYAHFITILNYI